MDQAWVVAVDMGYGHQRAAYPFRDIAYEGIITANTGAMVDPAERKRWMTMQSLYEGISRVNKVPVIGPWLWRTYDRLQAISPHYPFRDLSKPSFGSMRLDRLMVKGFGSSVVEHTRKREDLPLLTTFFAIALAADYLGRKDVFCVVTDTDVNRIWAAKVPAKGRIHYLVPTPLTRQRLMQYGVPAERIHFTGFPLPEENVATAAEDLRRRIPVLDAQGAFRHGYGRMIDAELGPAPAADARPLSITFAVGGAGRKPSWRGTSSRACPAPCARGACGSTWSPGCVPRWSSTSAGSSANSGSRRNSGGASTCCWRPPRTSTSRSSTNCCIVTGRDK